MGSTVLDAGASTPDLHLYAHCLANHPGGVALLAINLNRTRDQALELPTSAERYTLSAGALEASDVQLNGRELKLTSDDRVPEFQAERMPAGTVKLAPTTITFLAVPDAGNDNCRK